MNHSELSRELGGQLEFEHHRKATRLPKSPDQHILFNTYNKIAPVLFAERLKQHSHFEEFVWPVFTQVLGDISGLTVIDLGCGPGVVPKKLADAGAEKVVGLDLSSKMLTIAKKYDGNDKCHPEYAQGNMVDIPIKSEFADLVTASYVFNHVGQRDLKSTLKEGRRVLKAQGRFLIIDPHPDRCQLYYKANGGKKDKYPRGWYMEGWPELGEDAIPVYYRHNEDWVNAFQKSGFKQMRMYTPTSKNSHLSDLSEDIISHYAENRILIIELIK